MNYDVKACLKDQFKVIAAGCLALLLIFGFLLILFSNPTQWFPQEGVWYCEDLAIQIAFDDSSQTFAMVNGEKISCACEIDRGSKDIRISCQQPDHPLFSLGKFIFSGEQVKLHDDQLVVQDDHGNQYTFTRIR